MFLDILTVMAEFSTSVTLHQTDQLVFEPLCCPSPLINSHSFVMNRAWIQRVFLNSALDGIHYILRASLNDLLNNFFKDLEWRKILLKEKTWKFMTLYTFSKHVCRITQVINMIWQWNHDGNGGVPPLASQWNVTWWNSKLRLFSNVKKQYMTYKYCFHVRTKPRCHRVGC